MKTTSLDSKQNFKDVVFSLFFIASIVVWANKDEGPQVLMDGVYKMASGHLQAVSCERVSDQVSDDYTLEVAKIKLFGMISDYRHGTLTAKESATNDNYSLMLKSESKGVIYPNFTSRKIRDKVCVFFAMGSDMDNKRK